jgi:hypothetical protein
MTKAGSPIGHMSHLLSPTLFQYCPFPYIMRLRLDEDTMVAIFSLFAVVLFVCAGASAWISYRRYRRGDSYVFTAGTATGFCVSGLIILFGTWAFTSALLRY